MREVWYVWRVFNDYDLRPAGVVCVYSSEEQAAAHVEMITRLQTEIKESAPIGLYGREGHGSWAEDELKQIKLLDPTADWILFRYEVRKAPFRLHVDQFLEDPPGAT